MKWLGAPRRPSRVPGSNSHYLDFERAFRALSLGGADRALAEKPVAAFLADDATAPLAALALARMGADASATVPRLSRILDGLSPVWTQAPQGSSHQAYFDQLTQLVDTVDALRAIGKPAHSVLPSVCSFILRTEVPACLTLHDYHYVRLVRAIATPADAQEVATCLAPLLVCPGNKDLLVQALGEFGASARAPLLSMLRDNGRTIGERLEADFANCLSTYLCGPTAETYARTMGRCCASIPRPELPAFCVGLSDAGATTAAPGRP